MVDSASSEKLYPPTNSPNDRRPAIARSVVFWVGFFAFFFLTRVVVGRIGKSGTSGQWYGAAMMIVLLLIWTRVCVRMENRLVNPGTSLTPGSIPRTLLGLTFAAPLCGISLISLKWLVPGVEFGFKRTDVGPVFTSALLFLALSAYEEIGFRGYPLVRLLPSFGIWPTLLLIAPVFAFYHAAMGWDPVPAAVGTGVGSLLFGMAAIAARRGLAFPIGVHAGWNFTTWCLTGGTGPWKMTIPSNLSHRVQTVGMIMYVVCMLFGTILLWLWTKRRASLSPDDLSRLDPADSSV
jgi:membrane protease YdiL (CAAX protease family)